MVICLLLCFCILVLLVLACNLLGWEVGFVIGCRFLCVECCFVECGYVNSVVICALM